MSRLAIEAFYMYYCMILITPTVALLNTGTERIMRGMRCNNPEWTRMIPECTGIIPECMDWNHTGMILEWTGMNRNGPGMN